MVNGEKWTFTFKKIRAMEFADMLVKNEQLKEIMNKLDFVPSEELMSFYDNKNVKELLLDEYIFSSATISTSIISIYNGKENIDILNIKSEKWFEMIQFGPDNQLQFRYFRDQLTKFQFPTIEESDEIKN